MNSKDRKKLMAIGMLAVYMLSVLAIIVPDDEAVAYIEVGSSGSLIIGEYYGYIVDPGKDTTHGVTFITISGATVYQNSDFNKIATTGKTYDSYLVSFGGGKKGTGIFFKPTSSSVKIEVAVTGSTGSTRYTLNYSAVAMWHVIFDGNGGTPTSGEMYIKKGESITLPDATYDGHKFLGWYTSATGGTLVGQSGGTYKPTDDLTLYAQWIPEYIITLDANGGNVSTNSFTVDQGQSIALPTPTWPHYRFLGWYDGNTQVSNPYTPTRSVTLTAHWEEVPVIVTFKGQNNYTLATIAIHWDTTPMVFTPNFDDAVFTGWFYDQSFTQPFDPLIPISDDLTLYAQAQEYLRFTSNPISNGVISTLYNSNMFVFDATPSESAMSIVWDFGDGTTSTDRIAYHTYAEHGTYQVTLTSTNYYGQEDSVTYEVIYGSEAGSWSFTSFAVGFAAVMVVALLVARRV